MGPDARTPNSEPSEGRSRTSALAAALLLAQLACGNGKKPTSASKDEDAGAAPLMTLHWNAGLADGSRLVASGSFVLGEWASTLAPALTPPEIRAFQTATGDQTQRDRGWVLYAGPSPNKAVVVDESSIELTYGIRTFSRPATEMVALPAPAPGVWPLRGVACGNDPAACAVVRWAPVAGADSIKGGQAERLAVTVVDVNAMTVGRTFILDSLDEYAGHDTTGGVVANPTKPDLYINEWDPNDADALFVRCVSLSTGEQRWRARLPTPEGAADVSDQVVLPTADGLQLVVGRGDFAWGLLSLAELSVIDAETGAVSTVPSIPDGWSQVILLRDVAGAGIVALRIASWKLGVTESPTMAFLGVARFDARTRTFSEVLDPAADAKTPAEIEERRSKVPTDGVVIGPRDVVLAAAGSSVPGQDTDPALRRRRTDALDRLLGRQP